MIKKIAYIIASVAVGASLLAVLFPTSVAACDNDARFLTFRPWYSGLCEGGEVRICEQQPCADDADLANSVFLIAFNILFNLIQVVAYVAVAFIIYGGFMYIMSRGNPDGIAKGKKTILNSVIGLVIAILASAIVNTVQGIVGTVRLDATGGGDPLTNILNTVYFAIGLSAVVVIAYSGFVYITSSGDPAKITKAKQSIIYAIVGLIVAIAAWAITSFVLEGVT
ncbi:pilin [Candidatus Saccharibacteria bacterium]|nr:pilin [Candidatus Saccharibacteria bacterium]